MSLLLRFLCVAHCVLLSERGFAVHLHDSEPAQGEGQLVMLSLSNSVRKGKRHELRQFVQKKHGVPLRVLGCLAERSCVALHAGVNQGRTPRA